MKKILDTLSSEFKELFPSSTSEKELFDELENLKSFQWSLSPKKEFRENLKSRLEAIYTMEHGWELTRFSLFQYISIFTSFVLISGVGYIVYDANQTPIEQNIQNQMMVGESENINTVQSASSASDIKSQILERAEQAKLTKQLLEDIDMQWSSLESISENTSGNSQTLTEENFENLTQQDEEEKVDFKQEEPQAKSSQATSSFSLDADTQVWDSIVEPDYEIQTRLQIEPQSVPIVESDIQKDELGDMIDIIKNDILDISDDEYQATPMMLDTFEENSTFWDIHDVEDFKQLCNEYGWDLSEDKKICTLQNGDQCLEKEFKKCATSSGNLNNVENQADDFLQELIDEFGQ